MIVMLGWSLFICSAKECLTEFMSFGALISTTPTPSKMQQILPAPLPLIDRQIVIHILQQLIRVKIHELIKIQGPLYQGLKHHGPL